MCSYQVVSVNHSVLKPTIPLGHLRLLRCILLFALGFCFLPQQHGRMSAIQNPPKRPRLSLQIKAISSGPNLRASRTIAAVVNPTSPTSFNTLSNVYATAIDRSGTPVTAINTKQPLKIQTQDLAQSQVQYGNATPFVSTYPETPLTAQPISPAVANLQEVRFPSTMTATPPLSAGPVDGNEARPFSFDPADTTTSTLSTVPSTSLPPPATATPTSAVRRRATAPPTASRSAGPLPYVRNRALHSILRNSPLPPASARTPISPRRQSQRLAEKAARRVGYESPIERVIVTNQYVRSHIDLLLADDGSSPLSAVQPSPDPTDPILGLTGDDTRDGGMTPGPFEEMRRRMAGLVTRTPTSPVAGSSPAGVRKRRKKESRRRWVWTIGTLEEGEEGVQGEGSGAIAAMCQAPRAVGPSVAVESPMDIATPSVEAIEDGDSDVVMSDSDAQASYVVGAVERRAVSLPLGDMDLDLVTPTIASKNHLEPMLLRSMRQDSEGLFNPETGSRRDTPVPADLVAAER